MLSLALLASEEALYPMAYLTDRPEEIALGIGFVAGRRLKLDQLLLVLFMSGLAAFLLAPVVVDLVIALALLDQLRGQGRRTVFIALGATILWFGLGVASATASAVPLVFACARAVRKPEQRRRQAQSTHLGGVAGGLIPGFSGARTEVENADNAATEVAAMTTIAIRKPTGITVLSERLSSLTESPNYALLGFLVAGLLAGRLIPRPKWKCFWVNRLTLPIVVTVSFISLPFWTALVAVGLGVLLGHVPEGPMTLVKTMILGSRFYTR